MRDRFFAFLGLMEVALAAALILLGLALPGAEEVHRGFDGAGRATSAAVVQVQALRDQVDQLRRSRLRQSAERLAESTRTLTTSLRAGRLDFDAVRTIRDATGRTAEGLDGIATALDPDSLAGLGDGLGAAADYLDREVVPAATRAADGLDSASSRLQAGVRQFARIARQAPPDLKPLREIHDGLARFDQGLGAIHATLDPRRLAALRQAIGGAEGVVDEAARLADRAAGYTYPVVTLDGLKPRVASRPFWPRGSEVAADMRQVAGGVVAMEKEIGALAEELPKIQAAVAEGRKSIGATRATLAGALGRQAEAERLLAEIPEQSARLAEELPRLAEDLTRALRGADRLKGVANALRRSRAGLDVTRSSLPAVQRGIAGSAALLRAARDQMDQTLAHRREYEAARDQAEGLAGDLSGLLPALGEGLDARLRREDQTLAEMAGGLEQAGRVLPAYAVALGRCSSIGRLLACLVATIAGVHGSVLLLGGFPGRRRTLVSTPAIVTPSGADDIQAGGLTGPRR